MSKLPEGWRQGKISDILTIKYGKSQKAVENPNGKYPILGTGGLMGYANDFLFDKPSVLIGRKGTIDKPQYMEIPFWTVDTLFYSDIKDNNLPLWVYYVFLTINWKKYNEASDIPSLSIQNINNIFINIPPLEEQKKIAEILSTVDQKIAFVDNQIEETKLLKKGLMQKLLTEGIGHSEFKDSELGRIPESWLIKEIQESTDYVGYREKTPTKTKNGIFLVTARNIKNNKIDYTLSQEFISVEDYDNVMSRGLPKVGDILLTTEAPMGEITMVDREDIALAQRIIKYRGKNNLLDNAYLKYCFLSSYFQKLLDLNSVGSTVKGIKGSRLKKLKIMIPPLKEQKQIAKILSTTDEKLDNLKAKKKSFEELKKGLMQKLLTGEVRV